MSTSVAPREARPISWEKEAKSGSANMGAWPSSSWHISVVKGEKGAKVMVKGGVRR